MVGLEDIALALANPLEILERIAKLGDRGTAGPDAAAHEPVDETHPPAPRWRDGRWAQARQLAADPGRIGPPIAPEVIVDHTTDMADEDWEPLLVAFSTRPGDGACCTFLVGKTAAQGTVQFMPITRNANHAGGPRHGVYIDPARPGPPIHPNTIAVGIEFHCAGGQVRLVAGVWRYVEDGKIHGGPIAADQVEPDPQRPGRGWQKLTPYQEDVRARLHADLELVLRPMRAGLRAVSVGEAVPAWGMAASARRVGHVTLDAEHRSDPWPNGMRALR